MSYKLGELELLHIHAVQSAIIYTGFTVFWRVFDKN